MTDHLTEAVRRLRQLQEDVERLKSGGDQGELRELRVVDENTACGDTVETGADASVDENTACGDTVETGADASVDETAQSAEAVTATTTTATNIAEYDIDSYDDGSTYG